MPSPASETPDRQPESGLVLPASQVNSTVLILAGLGLGLFFLGQKARVDWITSIKSALLRMMVPDADRRLFKSFISSPIGWIRNPVVWVRAFDWTGVAAGINGLGGVGGGTLITRRHVLLANHVPYPARPFEIFFTNAADKTFTYRVVKIDRLGDTDIAVGTLDQDADSSLRVYRILPENWTQYVTAKQESFNVMGVSGIKTLLSLPVLYVNQLKKVATGDLVSINGNEAQVNAPTFEPARPYSEKVIVGDSGNPIFVQVGDELVLLGGWWKNGSFAMEIGFFPWLAGYRGAVENLIGQKLQVVDMTAFDKLSG